MWKHPQEPCATAKWIGDRGLNLPSGVCLKREQVEPMMAEQRTSVKFQSVYPEEQAW